MLSVIDLQGPFFSSGEAKNMFPLVENIDKNNPVACGLPEQPYYNTFAGHSFVLHFF